MLHVFREVGIMQNEGKIHKKLLGQIRIMGGIGIVLLAIVAFEIIVGGVKSLHALTLALVGATLGLYLFAPLNTAKWDEEQEVVVAKRIDALGFSAIGIYIVFVIGLRMFLKQNFGSEVTMLILSLVSGMLVGRVIGTITGIHRAFRRTHI